MRRMQFMTGGLSLLLLAAIGLSASGQAVRETALMIGSGWAVIRERRPVALAVGEQEILLEGIPREADLSTLEIQARRFDVSLLDWSEIREPAPSARTDTAQAFSLPPANAREAPASTSPLRTVRCRLTSPVSGNKVLSILYLARGFRWQTSYDIVLRGDIGSEGAVTAALEGRTTLWNPTARSYSNALVRLAGGEAPGADTRHAPGILQLDDTSPLSDLWKTPRREPPSESLYTLPERTELPAGRAQHARFISSPRMRAEFRYRFGTRLLPDGTLGAFQAFHRYLVFDNRSENGLGVPLPSGRAVIYRGGRGRRRLLQDGHLDQTPAGSLVRVDLGPARSVAARRSSAGREPLGHSSYEEAFQVHVENKLDHGIVAEIVEQPPQNLRYRILQANAPFEREGRKTVFRLPVEPGKIGALRYRLHFTQPRLGPAPEEVAPPSPRPSPMRIRP